MSQKGQGSITASLANSEIQAQGHPIANSDSGNQGRDSAGVSTTPQKVGSQRGLEVSSGDRKVSRQEEFNIKHLVPEDKSMGTLACH